MCDIIVWYAWCNRSLVHDGQIELTLLPAIALQRVEERLRYVLSSVWDGAYKRSLAANKKE